MSSSSSVRMHSPLTAMCAQRRIWDVWVRPEGANAKRVIEALKAFGAPTANVTASDFAAPGLTFQIGVEPVRIDVITGVDGITFDPSWERRVAAEYGGVAVCVLSRDDLIANKRASARPQDLADVAALEKHKQQ